MVITGRKMLKIFAVLAVAAAVVFVVMSLIRGESISEIFTNPAHLPIFMGAVACTLVAFVLPDENKDNKEESDDKDNKEEK